MLNSLITSKTRLRLLIKFFISQANKAHLNGLANEFGESTNSIRKELNNLFDAGYLLKSKSNNKIEYNVNPKHPLYKTMRKVVMKHLGLEDIVETVLEKMGAIEKIILIGEEFFKLRSSYKTFNFYKSHKSYINLMKKDLEYGKNIFVMGSRLNNLDKVIQNIC